MDHIKHYKAEYLLLIMMITQGTTLFFPQFISRGMSNFALLILLIAFIICKLERIDYVIKRKFN